MINSEMEKLFKLAGKPRCRCLNCQIRFIFDETGNVMRERTIIELEKLLESYKDNALIAPIILGELELRLKQKIKGFS
jgi:hypothetical protein